jgi:hypothetical protein
MADLQMSTESIVGFFFLPRKVRWEGIESDCTRTGETLCPYKTREIIERKHTHTNTRTQKER